MSKPVYLLWQWKKLNSFEQNCYSQLKQLILPPEGVERNNPPLGEPLDEGYESLDGDYFSKSDEEDQELKNAAAEGKNHLVTKNSKIE